MIWRSDESGHRPDSKRIPNDSWPWTTSSLECACMGWPVTCFCDQGDGMWLLWLCYIQVSGDSSASADLSEWFVGGTRSCLNISPWPSSTSGPNETSTIINGPFVSLCDFFLSCGFESFYLYSWYSAFYYVDSPCGFCLFYSPSEAFCMHSVVDSSEPLPISFTPCPPIQSSEQSSC